MNLRPYVYATLALLASLPAAARAALVQATVSAQASTPAGATVQVVCYAEGRNPGGMFGGESMQYVDVTVSGGTVSPTRIAGPAVQSTTCKSGLATCNVIQGSVSWTTPSAPAALTATCTATYKGGFTGGTIMTAAGSATLTTVAAGPLPPIVSPVAGPAELVIGTSAGFSVSASDPNVPPKPLTYAWAASGGTITADPTNPAAVRWQAPATAGTYQLTATVSNGAATSVSTGSVSVVLAAFQSQLPVPVVAPRRLAESDTGGLFVVDGDQAAMGRVALLDPAGAVRGYAALPEPALALTYGAGFLWVTTSKGNLVKVDTRLGRFAGHVVLAGGRFARPSGIAWDATNMALWVADSDAGRVRVVRPDGTTLAVIDSAGGAPLAGPIDVAVDPVGGRAWVLVSSAKAYPAPGDPASVGMFLHTYDLATRAYVASFGPSGTATGQLTRTGGLTIGGGRVYVSDIFQGSVQVYAPNGSPLGTVGAFGQAQGQLMNPMGLTSMANGDLAVANASLGRVDRFGNGAALPSCSGTTCTTNPWGPIATSPAGGGKRGRGHGHGKGNGDRDGDGRGDDGSGRASGPTVVATAPATSPPGLVRLQAVANGGDCAFLWTQTGGPAVKLGSANTASPSFVARRVATYSFDVAAACGGAGSTTSRVAVAVLNRPPVADAGRVQVVHPGSSFHLDASFSSDANGDPLSFSWDQTLGKPITGVETGALLDARPRGEGLYAFQVTVSDGRGGQTVGEVPVLVATEEAPTAVAAVRPARPHAGETILLDASTSVVDGEGGFAWRQVAGPAVDLAGNAGPAASFVARSAGRYGFEVQVSRGALRSPPARVDVFVAPAGGELPTVAVTAPPEVVPAGAPVSLVSKGTGSALRYAWRQVAGPAAGLTSDDAPSATAVPFVPGFYVFEVAVRDGEVESLPARVAFEARAGGKAIPRAVAATPKPAAAVGELVFLDGRGSTGAARWRWTQVAGPWVVLGGQGAVTSFQAKEPGAYAFELEVDDGTTRSAPARVEINVTEGVE